jgi:hypothetical protein
MKKTFIAFVSIAFLSSCTNGGKLLTGTQRYAATQEQTVEILFETPARPHVTVGIATVMGGTMATETQMYRKLRKAAADMGANAVIVQQKDSGGTRGIGDRRNMSGAAIRYTEQSAQPKAAATKPRT